MTIERERYAFRRCLDDPKRVIGLPWDEFLCLPCCLIAGFVFHVAIYGLLVAFSLIAGLRMAKRGQGSGWLINRLFWYAPTCVGTLFLPRTPPTVKRFYLR